MASGTSVPLVLSQESSLITVPSKKKNASTKASDTRSFEAQLWEACEAQRGSVNASRYKHPVLGLVFLKYVNDNFEHYRNELAAKLADPKDEYYLEDESDRLDVLEDRDEYVAHNVFWIPTEARWSEVRDNATQTDIATRIDKVMDAIERENQILKGVLPKSFAASEIPQRNLTSLIGIVDGISFGREDHDGRDRLGQVYEFFLGKFSGIEGRAGEDYTPRSVVDLLVEMLEPYKGRIYDPCCGSGGMFVQSRKFLEAHGGSGGDLSVFGQESNAETWRLSKMNLALHGIDGNLGDRADSSFTADLHPDLRADYIITNPPFNLGEKGKTGWGRDRLMEDPRWKLGKTLLLPPESNANFAWILHFLYHLAPKGYAGFVLANGALSNTNRGEEVAIRKGLVEAGVVDCIVALPTKLFANTGIPVSLWFIGRNRGKTENHRGRENETLFIDARKLGAMVPGSRRQRELEAVDIARIVDTYHSFRNLKPASPYMDIDGFCKVATRADIEQQGFVLTPGRYVGTPEADEDELPAAERLEIIRKRLVEELDESAVVEKRLRELLERVVSDD
jgi:type I restriction enzyme M protein